ncbi:hypothetical protein O3M35_000558 [Rhynocoris fuscipes]|uniref:Translin n=1 Tax=Rhynocoris fuscipes TaxID=488301 RepID=A0AAW1DM01_9HEMI
MRDVVKEIEQISRELATVLQAIHLEKSSAESNLFRRKIHRFITFCLLTFLINFCIFFFFFFFLVPQIIEKSKSLLKDVNVWLIKLSEIVPKGEYYKYHDHWRWIVQKLVFDIALIQFLQNGELASKELVASTLSLKTDRVEGFHLDLEDYLHGLLQLASELSRLAVTSATSEDYSRPLQISQFVTELNAGFRLINFKNDSLRKHYDGLKYDLKKIEEVVYDISIRGLKPASTTETGDADKI